MADEDMHCPLDCVLRENGYCSVHEDFVGCLRAHDARIRELEGALTKEREKRSKVTSLLREAQKVLGPYPADAELDHRIEAALAEIEKEE
jgi:hypothetical protein